MNEILTQMGLLPKEIYIYDLLLSKGPLTASDIAKSSGEKRSNVYMLLDNLLDFKIIVTDDDRPVRKFKIADPSALSNLLETKQDKQRQIAAALAVVMPKIKMQYALSMDKPGVIHMSGLDGFKALLNAMVQAKSEVLLVASDQAANDHHVYDILQKGLAKRKAVGIKTRALFHNGPRNNEFQTIFAQRGIELRFIGDREFSGEVVLYDDNTVFTVYVPTLIVTIITNASIAQTMRTLFEELWSKSAVIDILD